jgi:anti-anti-sigma factor
MFLHTVPRRAFPAAFRQTDKGPPLGATPETQYRLLKANVQSGVLVLTITARELREYELTCRLRDELIDAVDRTSIKKVALDLGAVEFVTSCGFLPLLSLGRKLGDVGGRMVLCELADSVRNVFRATKLLITPTLPGSVFDERPTLATAIASLQRGLRCDNSWRRIHARFET